MCHYELGSLKKIMEVLFYTFMAFSFVVIGVVLMVQTASNFVAGLVKKRKLP